MKFNPLSEEDVLNLLPDGEYDLAIMSAEDCLSKAQNEQIKLTLSHVDSKGRDHIIYDYLTEKMMYKVKHFADATGMEALYEAGGYYAPDVKAVKVRAKVGRQEAKDGYPPKNVIKDYVKGNGAAPTQTGLPVDALQDDDSIPF